MNPDLEEHQEGWSWMWIPHNHLNSVKSMGTCKSFQLNSK